jgi:pSer/pThr/pTyr-binding forkhead associated (FHA) protein
VVRPIPNPVQQPPTPPQPSRGDIDDAPTRYINTGDIFKSVVVGVLVAVEGESEGEVYKLKDGENKIGRNPECDVQIPSRDISRPHAVLIHKNGTFAVRPLKPENPIFVNDERVEEVAQIGDRDFLKLGKTTLRLLSVA